MTQMQGIVSVHQSDDPEKSTKAASLRRSLSADMSTRCWLPDNTSAVIKNIEIDSSSSSDSDQENCETTRKGDVSNTHPNRIDIWTAIMSQKKQDDPVNRSPEYVHPLVKKSASSLSEKSLKVCTESLGSETGSDVFSSTNEDKQEEKEVVHKVVRPAACLSTIKKPQQARSFPPPVSSLASAACTNGPSLHMHARRADGRLVLEAVSVPPQKYFEAQRQNGRFLLTLININSPKKQQSHHGFDENEVIVSDEDRIKTGSLNERKMNSTVRVNTKEGKMEDVILDPPRRRATSATLVNSYEYLWRGKPTVASVIDPEMTQHRPPRKTKDQVLLRGNKADRLLPSLEGCKEPRRSHLMWEPFCIATS